MTAATTRIPIRVPTRTSTRTVRTPICTAPVLLMGACALVLSACDSDADIASQNLSKAADMFEIERRVVFYNGITNDYILMVEGRCSLGNDRSSSQMTVTCKTGPDEYKKHFLGLSDNVVNAGSFLTHFRSWRRSQSDPLRMMDAWGGARPAPGVCVCQAASLARAMRPARRLSLSR